MPNLGYACINVTLQNSKPKVTTGRTIRKDGFMKKGIGACSQIALQNTKDLFRIVVWNKNHGIHFYRMSSDIVPWASEYNLQDLPDYDEIKLWLGKIGEYAYKNDQRLTYHPGPYNVLSSPNEDVVNKTIRDLEHHSEMMDLMGLSHSPYNKINIHIGGVYGDKKGSAKRFCQNFERLTPMCQRRLTIENDDSVNKFSVADLYQYIFTDINIPIVFDYHHHSLNTGDLSEEDALELALCTWPEGIIPVVHYSESKSLHEANAKIRPQAHSDYVNGPINTYGYDLDIMIEAKQKELALVNLASSNFLI